MRHEGVANLRESLVQACLAWLGNACPHLPALPIKACGSAILEGVLKVVCAGRKQVWTRLKVRSVKCILPFAPTKPSAKGADQDFSDTLLGITLMPPSGP